jgi:1-acyl-sn-glycerol-3-phosphate acyltransferase
MEPWTLQPAEDLGLPPLERLRSPKREGGLISSVIRQGWWSIARCHLAIWHRFTVYGSENLPQHAPFVLVANHTSHLDAITLGAALPWQLRSRCFPLAAGDVFFESPFISTFAACFLNALPVWRKKRTGHSLQIFRERMLKEPCGYVLFPEGGRSRDGVMQPFKAGIGMLIAGTEAPIIPCYLDGCHRAMPPGHRFPRRSRIHLHVGKALRFAEVSNDKRGWQWIAQRVETAVRGLQIEATARTTRHRKAGE